MIVSYDRNLAPNRSLIYDHKTFIVQATGGHGLPCQVYQSQILKKKFYSFNL
jgi:hypothetical protein